MNSEVDVMHKERSTNRTVLALIAAGLLTVGCASPSSEDQFGNSVRQMISAQKYVPPDQQTRELPVLDGRKAEAGYNSYRKDTGDPKRLNADMSGGVGLGIQR